MARIVVIDGRGGVRDSLRRTLERAGHEVRDAGDGSEGLDLVRSRATDVVLTDVFLPGKCGLETIAELRRQSPDVNVVAMSGGAPGDPSLDLLPLARKLGARDTLAEPFGPEELLQTIRRVLVKPYRFLLDRYRILKRIGVGSTGNVYLAEHALLGRRVAVKIMHRSLRGRPDLVARFRRRIELAGILNHPSTVVAYDAGSYRGRYYLVMEHVRGPSLSELLETRGALPMRLACDIVRQAAEGLQYAHEKGVVHRTIEPGNLRVHQPRVGPAVVKVVDFRQAGFIGASNRSEPIRTARMFRMLDYVAPEQLENAGLVDGRVDVFGLGVTLFTALTGRSPCAGQNPAGRLPTRVGHVTPRLREHCPTAPKALDSLLARMLARDPADRLRTPGEVAAGLAAVIAPARRSARRTVELPDGQALSRFHRPRTKAA